MFLLGGQVINSSDFFFLSSLKQLFAGKKYYVAWWLLRYGASYYSSLTIVFQTNMLSIGSVSEICHTYTCKIYFKDLFVM